MNIDCEIIHDLLPLYKDGALTKKGKKAVKEHLESCPQCRMYLRRSNIKPIAKDSITPEYRYGALADRIKKRRNLNAVLIGVTIAALLGYGIFKTVQDYIK